MANIDLGVGGIGITEIEWHRENVSGNRGINPVMLITNDESQDNVGFPLAEVDKAVDRGNIHSTEEPLLSRNHVIPGCSITVSDGMVTVKDPANIILRRYTVNDLVTRTVTVIETDPSTKPPAQRRRAQFAESYMSIYNRARAMYPGNTPNAIQARQQYVKRTLGPWKRWDF